MGRLSERYVQDVALEYLEGYYLDKYSIFNIAAQKEVIVKKEYGGGRADGLIVIQTQQNPTYTASVEAKSYKTLFSISPIHLDEQLGFHAIGFGIGGALVMGVGAWLLRFHWFWTWVFPFFVFAGLGVLYIWMTSVKLPFYMHIDVLRQLDKYPANEKWLAFSVDCFHSLNEEQKNDLSFKSSSKGVGILTVGPNKKVTILLLPINKSKNEKKDYLSCYSREQDIRNCLSRSPENP